LQRGGGEMGVGVNDHGSLLRAIKAGCFVTNVGASEYWNTGILEGHQAQYSIIPSFQNSRSTFICHF
jgi:hypothetical protein